MRARGKQTSGLTLGILRVDGHPAATRYELFENDQAFIHWRRGLIRRNWREWVAPSIEAAAAAGRLHDARLLLTEPEELTDAQIDVASQLYKIAVTFEVVANMTVVRDELTTVRDQLDLFGAEAGTDEPGLPLPELSP